MGMNMGMKMDAVESEGGCVRVGSALVSGQWSMVRAVVCSWSVVAAVLRGRDEAALPWAPQRAHRAQQRG
jgi:hypothetical protein